MTFKPSFKKPICGRAVFVDGLARSGKSLIGRILCHLEGGEQWQGHATVQNMCYFHHLGGVPADVATCFIHNFTEENTYYRIIGRNLNTRSGDMSSIQKSADATTYHQRAKSPDGMEAVERFKKGNRFPVFQVHSVLRSASLVFGALPWSEWIHIMRHPVEQAHRWHARGWGIREVEDPLSFGLTFDTPNGRVPWYAVDWADLFFSLNPMERAVETTLRLQEEDEQGYLALSQEQQKQIHRLCLEYLVFDPGPAVDAISEFLKAPVLGQMKEMLAEERCPRPNDPDARRGVFKEVLSGIKPEMGERLRHAAGRYDERWGHESIAP